MSKIRVLSEIFSGTWLIDPQKAKGFLPVIADLMKNVSSEKDFSNERKKNHAKILSSAGVYEISEYGESIPPEKAPEGSVCVIPVNGPIMKYDSWCGPSGTKTKTDLLKRCESNPNIDAIILLIDSPGGEGAGTQDFALAISECNKPVVALVEDYAASAAYWIASACDYIFISNKTGLVGSIGGFSTFADYTQYFANKGIDVVDVYARQSKDKNANHRELFENKNNKVAENEISDYVAYFIDFVSEKRGSKIDMSVADPFTGKIFIAEKAIQAGLVDEIGNFEAAVSKAKELSNNTMSNQSNQNTMKISFNAFKNVFTALFGANANPDEEKEIKIEDIQTLENLIQEKELRIAELENTILSNQTEIENLNSSNQSIVDALGEDFSNEDPVQGVTSLKEKYVETKTAYDEAVKQIGDTKLFNKKGDSFDAPEGVVEDEPLFE